MVGVISRAVTGRLEGFVRAQVSYMSVINISNFIKAIYKGGHSNGGCDSDNVEDRF